MHHLPSDRTSSAAAGTLTEPVVRPQRPLWSARAQRYFTGFDEPAFLPTLSRLERRCSEASAVA